MNVAEAQSGPRAAIALYVALAVHALLLLLLALRPAAQDSTGPEIGISVSGEGMDEADRLLAIAPPVPRSGERDPTPLAPAEMPAGTTLDTAIAIPPAEPQSRPPSERTTRRAAQQGGGGSSRYFARLRAHLTQFRRELPPEWRGARARVALELGENGEVAAIELVESSGLPAFDAEALQLVRRAAPLPAPPERRSMRVVIPIAIDDRD